MAATYKPQDAYNAATWFVRNLLLGDVNNYVKYVICDMAVKHVWMAAPWRWSVGLLSNTTLTTATDYTVSLPGDFLRLQHCYWSDGNTVKQLEVVDTLPDTPIITGPVQMVALIAGSPNKLRVYPPMGSVGGTTFTLVSYYKKTAPSITSSNYATAGAFTVDDEYFPVIYAFVLYYAMLACHDARAGSAEWDESARAYKYSGQLATAQALLEDMRRREPLPLEWDHQPDRKADRR